MACDIRALHVKGEGGQPLLQDLNLRQQVQYKIDCGLMNVINKTSLASGGTTEKRIAYLFIAME